jgi:hypothetical protein
VTLHHNLFVAASQRNPTIAIDDVVLPATDTTVDMRNNVVWGWGFGVGTVVRNGAWVNVVANFYSSPDSLSLDQAQAVVVCATVCGSTTSYPARAYVAANYSPDPLAGNVNVTGTETAPFPAAPVTTTDPCTAAHDVVAGVGVRPLDAVDTAFLAGIALPPCIPDLMVASVVVPSMVTAGVPFLVADTTRNAGAGELRSAVVRFYLSYDALLSTTDTLLGGRVIPAMAGGEISAGATLITVPPATVAGLYRLIATADPDHDIIESNEANNVRAQYLRVVKPDLAVTALVAPTVATAGSTITVSDTTTNVGLGAAGPSSTRFFLSKDAITGAGDVELGVRSVPALLSRKFSTGSVPVTIPAGTPPGYYYVIGYADADRAVSEVRETANARARGILIK